MLTADGLPQAKSATFSIYRVGPPLEPVRVQETVQGTYDTEEAARAAAMTEAMRMVDSFGANA